MYVIGFCVGMCVCISMYVCMYVCRQDCMCVFMDVYKLNVCEYERNDEERKKV